MRKFGFLAAAVTVTMMPVFTPAPVAGETPVPPETVWETGTVTKVLDGDTITANLTPVAGNVTVVTGEHRVRTIGVQAPEVTSNPPQCGAREAETFLKKMLPAGTGVQTRAFSADSVDLERGRLVRALYAADEDGNWYDTARPLLTAGLALWFPFANDPTSGDPEWGHNLEYRLLSDDAEKNHAGLWGDALCGHPKKNNVKVWAVYTQTSGNPERVYVQNGNPVATDFSNWLIRDSALNFYTIPTGTKFVPAGGVLEVQFTGNPAILVPPAEGVSVTAAAPLSGVLNNVPQDNTAFTGDSVYLFDPADRYATGNLTAVFPYPCPPDACADPLPVKIVNSQLSPLPPVAPAAVTSLTVTPTGNNGGVFAEWVPPVDNGGSVVTSYQIRVDRSVVTTVTGVTNVTITNLPAGEHMFTVTPVNEKGTGITLGTPIVVNTLNKVPVTVTPTDTEKFTTRDPGVWVDLGNVSQGSVSLAGYGLFTKTELTGSSRKPQTVLPVNTVIPPNSTIRVHYGPPLFGTTPLGIHRVIETGTPAPWDTKSDRIVLRNLNLAEVTCEPVNTGKCPTQLNAATPPTPPVGVTSAGTPTSTTVTWGAPIATGGTHIASYTATVYPSQTSGEALTSCTTPPEVTKCDYLTPPGVPVWVEVTAENGVGVSAPTVRVKTTRRTTPSTPNPTVKTTQTVATTSAAPPFGSNRPVVTKTNTVTVSWNPSEGNGAPVTSYTATVYGTRTGGTPAGLCVTTGTSCAIVNLTPGVWWVGVTATNKIGISTESARVKIVTTEGITFATVYKKRTLTTTWKPVQGATKYEIVTFSDKNRSHKIGKCVTLATKCKTVFPKEHKNIWVTLTIVDEGGDKTPLPTVRTGVPQKPGKPTNVTAVKQKKSITTTWTPPAFTGNTKITTHVTKLYYKHALLNTCVTTTNTCKQKVNKKFNNKTLTVTVSTRNVTGTSYPVKVTVVEPATR
jgi:endonuclease YncB( thermonuclease family)